MYKIIFLCTCSGKAKNCLPGESNRALWAGYPYTLPTVLTAFIQYYSQLRYIYTVLAGGRWRTSCAGPAAPRPPSPAMTLPGRASTWTSLKPRPAAKQPIGVDLFPHLIWFLMDFLCSSVNLKPTIQFKLGVFFNFHWCCNAHWRISTRLR